MFATLTQVKRPRWEENPREAVHRLHRAWRELTNSKTATGRAFHRLFSGGLRSTETTWSPKDAEREHGGRVRFDGYHAHLHVIIEVRRGVDRAEAAGWLQREWLRLCPGSDAIAQVVRPANFADLDACVDARNKDDAHQLCKYVSKPLEDVAERPAILRELFSAIHGVRLLAAFGEWNAKKGERIGWREMGGEEDKDDGPPAPRWVGPTIGRVMLYASERTRPLGTTDRLAFVGRTPDDEVMVSAAEAWSLIEAAVHQRGVPVVARWRPPPRVIRGASLPS